MHVTIGWWGDIVANEPRTERERLAEFETLLAELDRLSAATKATARDFDNEAKWTSVVRRRSMLVFLFASVLLLVVAPSIYRAERYVPRFVEWYSGVKFRETNVSVLVALIGLGFYQLRRHLRLWYAVIEFSFALALIGTTVHSGRPDILLGLLAGVYVMVRGLQNYEEGINQTTAVMTAGMRKKNDEQRQQLEQIKNVTARMDALKKENESARKEEAAKRPTGDT